MNQRDRLEEASALDYLGIDVGKFELHVALLQGDKTAKKSVANNEAGFEQIVKWLKNRKAENVHVCMEATGIYGVAVAEYLYDRALRISVVNPGQIKAFGKSELLRTKTDDVDAALIARFCRAHRPSAWSPPAPHIRKLRALIRRRETLSAMIVAERNRLEAYPTPEVRRSIKAVIDSLTLEMETLEREIDDHANNNPDLRSKIDRLDEIPGFGALTAMKVIAETNDFEVCKTAKEIVAFAGLNPRIYSSGTIVRRAGISKIGNSALRKALYFAALSAKNRSAYFRPFVDRLKAAGKPPKVIITAIMRKLLVLAFTISRSGSAFQATFAA